MTVWYRGMGVFLFHCNDLVPNGVDLSSAADVAVGGTKPPHLLTSYCLEVVGVTVLLYQPPSPFRRNILEPRWKQ